MDDVLKSLTALDMNGGRISGANYNSQEPAGHQLESLPVPVAGKSKLSELLDELRGARMEIRTQTGVFAGRLMSVEQKETGDDSAKLGETQVSLIASKRRPPT